MAVAWAILTSSPCLPRYTSNVGTQLQAQAQAQAQAPGSRSTPCPPYLSSILEAKTKGGDAEFKKFLKGPTERTPGRLDRLDARPVGQFLAASEHQIPSSRMRAFLKQELSTAAYRVQVLAH